MEKYGNNSYIIHAKAYHLPRSFRLGLDESRFKEATVSITKAPVFEKTDIRQQRQVVESWNELLKVGTQTVSWFFSSPRDTGLNF